MCIVIIYCPVCDFINFESNHIFHFRLHDQKYQDKHLEILRTKRAFSMKWKVFFIIFKGAFIEASKNIFLEGESPTLS